MIIRKYVVNNMNEAMIKIKNDLGSEASIIGSKKIRQPGFSGFFKNKVLEVTAAADKIIPENKWENKWEDKNATNEKNIEKEISELKKIIENFTSETQKNIAMVGNVEKEDKLDIKDKFVEKGIDNNILNSIIKTIDNEYIYEDDNLEDLILEKIGESIETIKPDSGRVHVLVGPTGVGKTTTIAKLASMYTLYQNKKVGLVTLDTYRIGAVEQLKTYANILNIPFEVVISSKDVENAIDKMQDCEIVLVDTTGRSSKNFMQISETRSLIEKFNPDNIHLVLSMTTKNEDINSIVKNYSMLNYEDIILTKLDETDTYTGILNATYYSKKPITYICTGQDVPEDIENPIKEKLVGLVLGDIKNGPGI